jgi:hypothetical protein
MNFQPSPTAQLVQLFVRMFPRAMYLTRFFSAFNETRELVSALPDPWCSAEQMAHEAVTSLERHGLITRQLFVSLTDFARSRIPEILQVAAVWGIEISPHETRKMPIEENLKELDEKIILDPEATDLITLTFVSRKTGITQSVALSKHRVAWAAARDIFYAAILKGDALLTKVFSDDSFRIYKGKNRLKNDAIIGDILSEGDIVHLERIPSMKGSVCGPPGSIDMEFMDNIRAHAADDFDRLAQVVHYAAEAKKEERNASFDAGRLRQSAEFFEAQHEFGWTGVSIPLGALPDQT